MSSALSFRLPSPAAFLALSIVALAFSGCTLFGLGAAAGATVGGCALLDENEDNTVTEEEIAVGIHSAWDTDNDGVVSETEFDAGVNTRNRYAGWSGSFDDWDDNDDDALTQAEFSSGATSSGSTAAWVDARCDDLGL